MNGRLVFDVLEKDNKGLRPRGVWLNLGKLTLPSFGPIKIVL